MTWSQGWHSVPGVVAAPHRVRGPVGMVGGAVTLLSGMGLGVWVASTLWRKPDRVADGGASWRVPRS